MNTRPPVPSRRGQGLATLILITVVLAGSLQSAASWSSFAHASFETPSLPPPTRGWSSAPWVVAPTAHTPPDYVSISDVLTTADPLASRNHSTNPAGLSQEPQSCLLIDTIPPAPVINLTASQGTSLGEVELSWTAPGNDGMIGTAAAYVVRYNTEPINEDNWPTSIDITGEPIPQPAGSIQDMTVSGLAPNQAYHFALKTQDEAPNTSGVSNTPWAQAGGFPHSTFLPLALQAFAETPTVIPETTRVLSDSTNQYLLSISDNGVIFVFSQWTPELAALQPDDVMVGSIANNAPYGFLRRVTSVTSSGDQVIVNTTDATLEDAIESGSLEADGVLTPADVARSALAEGVLFSALPETANRFHITLNQVVLYDADGNPGTTHDQIRANGSIQLEPRYEFKVEWGWFKIKEISFRVGADETADLHISAQVSHPNLARDREIARFYFLPFVKQIGPVPVVIAPVLTVNVGVDGSVHIGMDTEVTQEARLRAGLRYAKGSWRLIREFSNRFQYSTPVLTGEQNLTGYASAQLSLRLYGIVGPYGRVRTYLQLRANADVLWWQLHGGLDTYAGVKLEILGVTIADYEAKLTAYRVLLAGVQDPSPQYPNPSYCLPCYPTLCIPPPPPDLNCSDIPHRNFPVVGCDPHRFDADQDGIGCET